MTKLGPDEFDWSYFKPLEVEVRGGNVDKAIKIFRSAVQADGILAKFKEKQSFEKPSDKKRRKEAEMIQRAFEERIKAENIASGEYDREKLKREIKKERRKVERSLKRDEEVKQSENGEASNAD